MYKSKLVTVLRTLTVSEMRDFGKFMEGTSYRTTGAIFQLYNFLKKQHPEYPEKKIDREYVKKALNKGGKNTGNRLPDLVSLLNTELEKFLIQKKLFEKEVKKEMLFLEVLRERGLDKMFFKRAANLEKNWDDYRGEGIEDLHNSFLLSRAEITHPNYGEPRLEIHAELLRRLDNYYLTAKLHYSSTLLLNIVDFASKNSRAEFLDQQFLLKELNSTLADKNKSDRPSLVTIVYTVFQGLLKGIDNYLLVKMLILDNLHLFNETEQYDLFVVLHRVCIEKRNAGEKGFLQEIFELYKIEVSSGIIFKDEFIPAQLFRYIVVVACALQELEWAEGFLKQYYNHLKDEAKEDIFQLCTAYILFAKKQFKNTITSLGAVKFTDVIYGVQARVVLLKSFYELEDQELFFNLVRSFVSFLDRNSLLSDQLIVDTRKFIHYANRSMLVKFDPEGDAKKLIQDFEEEARIVSKLWLNEKMGELQKK